MLKRLIFLWIAILLIAPAPVHAQGEVKLDFLSIELWAEYDQPSMLVINEFVVSPETPLPTRVTLRFPKDGNLIAVAFNSDGQLVNAPFETPAQQGGWQTVTLLVDVYAPHRIEYYQPIVREGNRRSFSFKWFGDYQVNQLSLTLLIPADSTATNLSPADAPFEPSADGRSLVSSNFISAMKMGQSYQLELEYERLSDELTSPNAASQVQPSEPLGEDTTGRTSVDRLPWIIGGVGLGLIGFALVLYRRSLRAGSPASTHTRRRRGSSTGTPAQDVYCHQCGARATAGDRFCRTCGSKLRTE
jgi:hypothetical protein